MSVMIDEDRAGAPRLGLASGFAGGPPGGGSGDSAESWRRLWFTLGALIVYRIGSYLPIPGVDLLAMANFLRTSSPGILGLLDLFAGMGVIGNLSIFALGILPYISAAVIVALASRIAPRLNSLAARGPTGRRQLNQYARVITIVLAALQASGIALALESYPGLVVAPGLLFEATTVLALSAGAVLVMWIAEQIAVRGIGNGALVIVVCSIVSHLPFDISRLFNAVETGDLNLRWVLGILLMTAAVVPLVVLVERAARWITIYDPRGEIGVRAADRRYARIALKLNPAHVWAPIAAGILAPPLSITVASTGGRGTLLYEHFMIAGSGYFLLYGLLIALFAVCFDVATFDAEQTARTLKDTGGFVPGYRPGENTARYLRAVQTALALFGGASLAVICVVPDVIYRSVAIWPPLGGYQVFLLVWLMLRILDQMRPSAAPHP